MRCYGNKSSFSINKCYAGSFLCDLWKNDKDAFAEWYSEKYYAKITLFGHDR